MITCTSNGKIYIGSSEDINKRWNFHKSQLNRNKHHSKYLQRCFNKYGEDSFKWEIIHETIDINDLLQDEQFYLDTLNPEFNSYKIAGSPKGFKHTEETKKKMSLSKIGNSPSLETREKLRVSMMNNKHWLGKKHKKESNIKRSQSLNNSEAFKNSRDSIKKSILQYDLNGNFIKEWISIIDASKQLNIDSSCISKCCKGKRKTANNYKWKYKNE